MKYQRIFGFYSLLENQYSGKVNERLNSVFRNSAWQCLERQSTTDFGQCTHHSKYLQHTVFAICSQILGGIVAFTGIRDYNYSDMELFKTVWMFSRISVCFSSPSLQPHSKSYSCNQKWIKNASTKPPSYQPASKIYELQAQQERLLKLLRQSQKEKHHFIAWGIRKLREWVRRQMRNTVCKKILW